MLRNAVVVGRLVFAAATLAGILTQLVITVTGDHGVVNFFSYFTILSNLLAGLVFVAGAVRLARGQEDGPLAVAIRGASVVYMLFVGVVFSTLLSGADLGPLEPWVNTVHHYVMPVVVLVDWLVWPPARRLPLRTAALYLLFPLIYTVYSLIRGAVTGWYAYPFFNPSVSGGYGGVALLCAGMLVAFLLIALLVRWLGNARVRATPTPRVAGRL
ncbi:Pr6Pr family membrane protein [Nakamurella flavida]|uniref:Pr6Pr family membrane protein n=1 Tax=Nakamurella flavida TaxID=363630 RepID=A0A938YLI9_9ACTN|nr:Pr6Pr family membrane protein [Nakamurella flavida]MBM9476756.1 Pr6Pr family membrane protein [Nakamurella flavida]MDP9778806.1 hypothetical protein [Nakamurella flavida]